MIARGCDESRTGAGRSEEHTSELQSRRDLVCRLLLALPRPPRSTLVPYTTLFRSGPRVVHRGGEDFHLAGAAPEEDEDEDEEPCATVPGTHVRASPRPASL